MVGRPAGRRRGRPTRRNRAAGGLALAAVLRRGRLGRACTRDDRKPGKAPLSDATGRRVVALTCAEPPGEATHWTGRAMARTAAISLRFGARIWAAHQPQPHRIRSFKRSREPDLAAKLEAIVGLYVEPPRHAVVPSVDERAEAGAAAPVIFGPHGRLGPGRATSIANRRGSGLRNELRKASHVTRPLSTATRHHHA
jgi:hypothetical protein